MLKDWGATVVLEKSFRDHHFYSENDLAHLQTEAQNAGALALVTTQKDGIKIPIDWLRMPLIVVEGRLRPHESFFRFLRERLPECVTS
jgi:tetraacyldisaccharide-1-P 4'-kinase